MTRLFASVRLLACLLVLGSAAAWSGCARQAKLPAAGSVGADQFLFQRGTEALAKKHWLEAREYFRRLVDSYPQSPYRADAKLGLGDSYLGENTVESNILAIGEFREFLTYFPLNPKADYAQYKIGVAHFRQMLSPERDQTATEEAIREFDTFLKGYPNSQLRPEVEKLRREARDRLSEAEFIKGRFYVRSMKWAPGAISRLKALLTDDPEYTRRDGVYFWMGESHMLLKQPADALPWYEKLVAEFQKSEYLERAQKRIAELKRVADVKR